MLPLPTTNAIAVFVGACAMVGVGIAGSSAPAIMLGSVILIGLAAVFALTLPVGVRLRRDRLELAWWHTPHGEQVSTRGSVVAGARFDVQASLRHFGPRPLVLSQLVPAHGTALRCVRGAHGAVMLPGQSRSEFELGFVAAAPGRLVLHGLSVMVHGPLDLFRAPLYFPIPLVLRALPRTAASIHVPVRESAVATHRSGQTLRRRPGGGTELREVRELVPGDPFKMIAWKASARAGKLMVREMESEVQQTLYVVLDISGTMRGGAPGDRKLDYAIELSASLLRSALERGDQAGLITADGRVVAHAPAREGYAHMATLDEVLLGATEVIDADLTEPTDDEVVALVARYVRHQDGLDFRRRGVVDLDALSRHVRAALVGEHEPRMLAKGSIPSEPRVLWLRRFCRARGIELRYRTETRGFGKGQGIAQALRAAAGGSRVPRTIVVVTDFDGVADPSVLEATLRMLRARQHAISFIVPDAPSLLPRPASRLVADLQFVFTLSEARRTADMRAFLYKLGVPLLVSARRAAARPLHATQESA